MRRWLIKLPRCARVKSFDSIYHIMIRSISDTLLFRTNGDKDKFLDYIKKYEIIYSFKLYAYCLMDNHAHLAIDANGADISQIMHDINQSYAQYFNRIHGRRGHLFQDRFKSKIVPDEKYLLNLSAYIHKNPLDLWQYKNCIADYNYSSLGIYLGIREDEHNIVDVDFVMSFFGKGSLDARKNYMEFINLFNEIKFSDEMEFKNEKSEYRSERKIPYREHTPEEVVDIIASYTNNDKRCINIKNVRKANEFKSICAFIMRSFCNMNQRKICAIMGNINQSQASRLCLKGYYLIHKDKKYKEILEHFLSITVS